MGVGVSDKLRPELEDKYPDRYKIVHFQLRNVDKTPGIQHGKQVFGLALNLNTSKTDWVRSLRKSLENSGFMNPRMRKVSNHDFKFSNIHNLGGRKIFETY